MKKLLPIPSNWQDFEDLCKELWREEWKCREIHSHGRNGQAQQGVDLFGIPNDEKEYYGIQCKHKLNGKSLSETEISKEIKNAKSFEPALKMLYIVTTASSDAKIQQFVREKDVENRKSNLFGVTIFSWQEICDILRQHKRVYVWYLTEKFNNRNIKLTINGQDTNNESPILNPHFIKKICEVMYSNPIELTSEKDNSFTMVDELNKLANNSFSSKTFISPIPIDPFSRVIKQNKSLVKLNIAINNTGDEALENIFLYLTIHDVDYANGIFFQYNDTLIDENEAHRKLQEFKYNPSNQTLNSGMMMETSIFISLPSDPITLNLSFEFFSKHHNESGEILIKSEPLITERHKNRLTTKKEEVGITSSIELNIEEKRLSISDLIKPI